MELKRLNQWGSSMKYDQYFATQYKECFVYFGIPVVTSEAETDNRVCTMSGCVATLLKWIKKMGTFGFPCLN